MRDEAIAEGKRITKCLKHRLEERVGSDSVNFAVSTAGVAVMAVGIFCPPGALGLANYAYSQFIPDGDILDTEKRMLYSRAIKVIRNGAEKIQNIFLNKGVALK